MAGLRRQAHRRRTHLRIVVMREIMLCPFATEKDNERSLSGETGETQRETARDIHDAFSRHRGVAGVCELRLELIF